MRKVPWDDADAAAFVRWAQSAAVRDVIPSSLAQRIEKGSVSGGDLEGMLSLLPKDVRSKARNAVRVARHRQEKLRGISVEIPNPLAKRVRDAAKSASLTEGEWIREKLEEVLDGEKHERATAETINHRAS